MREEELNNLEKIASLPARLEPAAWEDLPDLGLYMDQVTGYLNRLLRPFSLEGEGTLTPSMINNYVKSGHISRPVNKKYSREQISALYMLCSLKNTLSIPDAAALIYFMTTQDGTAAAHDRFVEGQARAIAAVGEQFCQLPQEPDMQRLTALAMDLVQRACAERLAAEALIAHMLIRDDAKMARMREEAEAAHKEAAKAPKES